MTLKVVYIEYMNFLALKLNINPLYGWCAPLTLPVPRGGKFARIFFVRR